MGGDPRRAGPGIALAIVGIISLLVHLAMTVLNLLFGGIAAMELLRVTMPRSGCSLASSAQSSTFFLLLQVVTIGGFKMNLQSYASDGSSHHRSAALHELLVLPDRSADRHLGARRFDEARSQSRR
jgi:hypothetical protein